MGYKKPVLTRCLGVWKSFVRGVISGVLEGVWGEHIYTEDNAQNFHDEVIILWSNTV